MRLTDGSPVHLVTSEEYIVGGAMWATAADVRCIDLSPRDFRDPSLGAIWTAIRDVDEPTYPVVASRLLELGWLDKVGAEPRLVELSGAVLLLYGGLPWMQAHASIIKDWSNRRAAIKQASQVAKAAYEGKKTTSLYDRTEYQNLDGLV